MTRTLSALAIASIVMTLAGCGENPAQNVPPAVTGSPKSVGPDPAKPVLDKEPVPAAKTEKKAEGADSKPAAAEKKEEPKGAAAAPTTGAGVLAIAAETGSKIGFIGSKTVGGSHTGGFNKWTGAIDLTADGKSVGKISVDIDMNSIFSDDEKLTAHLKNKDFFEVDKFPKASFVTSEIKAEAGKGTTHVLSGNLTLHGVTKGVTIPATVKIADGTVSITSEFSIKRSEWGMTFTGPGGVVRDEVVIKLDVKSAKKS
jgi:polyisoprenoid-binding protein YceI